MGDKALFVLLQIEMRGKKMSEEMVNHPPHYGGEGNPYEAIKVIEAWELNFNIGSAAKYIARLGKKTPEPGKTVEDMIIQDLGKVAFYVSRELNTRKEKRNAEQN